MARKSIYDLDLIDLRLFLDSNGVEPYRVNQIWRGLYQNLWDKPEKFTPLSKLLRQSLEDDFVFSALVPQVSLESSDGFTKKTLFQLKDNLSIETVLMAYPGTGSNQSRNTLCISTQVGCALGCVFCATGQMGYLRNLSSGEIVEQVIFFERELRKTGEKLSNVVFMGMGEPFKNYEATFRAVNCLNNPEGFNFGARRFTISTVGIIPGIRKFTSENSQVNLAISLHAVDDELRNSILPINKRYPLNDLMNACMDYVETTRRRITFEWALIDGINDSSEQSEKLSQLLKRFNLSGSFLCHVNLIPLNPTYNYKYTATQRQKVLDFQGILQRSNIPCTIRSRRGIDIQAGCGQLALKSKKERWN